MFRVAEYKCSSCGRSAQLIEEKQTQGPLSCNITLNCTGYLSFIRYRTTRTQIVSPQVADDPVEDFIQRGFDTTSTGSTTSTNTSLLSGANAMNICVAESDVKSSVANESLMIPRETIISLANESSDVTEHIGDGFINDGFADYIKLKLESKNTALTVRAQYTFSKSIGAITITGEDINGNTLAILDTDTLVVSVNGEVLTSAEYTRYSNRIVLASPILFSASEVIITCKEYKIINELTLTFKKVSNILSQSEVVISDEFSKYDDLFLSSWNNIAKIKQAGVAFINYYSTDLENLTVSLDEFTLTEMSFVFMYKYKRPVINVYNVWKTYDGYNGYIEVVEKTLTSNFPGMILLGDSPYKFESKNENEAISISKLQDNKTVIEYNSGVDLMISSTTVQKVFPPFDLSTRQQNVSRNIVSTNTVVNNKKQNIIGPV
jgi:hypothetical protein